MTPQDVLRAIEESNEIIEHHFDERIKKTAAFIHSGVPFTVGRVALLLQAIEEWVTTAASERKIRGEDSLIVCLQDAVAFLDEVYEPSSKELDLEAQDAAADSRITQDKEDRS